ncbi:hypothetical protein LTR40_005045 [Exophiala xenobiotica]|nr:hypothetical protein LTR40_005045 [Exophiala xenobiotica]
MTTPTSWSSTSPSVVQHMPVKTSGKRSQTVPVRQAKRGNIPEVPALPEPFSASRANSALSSKEVKRSPSRKRTPLSTPAPTPPPRTSSAKQSLSRSSSRSRKPQQLTPPSSEPEGSPVSRRTQKDMDNIADVLPRDSVTRAHGDLQQSLAAQWVQQGQPVMMPWGTDSNRARVWAGRPKDHGIVEHVLDADTRERDLIRSGHQPITPSETVPTVPESPSRLGKLSRLGIFGRRGKSPAKEVERSPRKLQRRGPATGTGHEGYGRYGLRGRKASQETASANNSESERSVSSTRRAPVFSSKGSASRSSSRHHRNSQSDLDEFASNRMKPVPIIGGSGNSLRSESDSRVDVFDRTLQPLGSDLREAMPSPDVSIFGNTADLLDHVHSQEPRPTLAVRRSQRFGKDSETFNIPTSIRTDQISVPLYVTSLDEGRASAVAISTSTPSSTAEYNRGDAGSTRTKDKRTRRLRWNIFRRKETEVESQKTFIPPSASPEEMTVTISTVPAPRSMPYYAMMDSESEVNHNEHVGDFLEQVIESPAISPLMREYEPDYMQTKHAQQGYNEEPYLPPAPTSPPHFFASPLPAVPLPSPHEQPPLQPEQPSQKPPRLPRVGRIPQVVPRAEREHKPSRSSFSQPFARTSAPEINTVVMNVGPSHQENVDLLDVVARNKDPVGQSELHYASLMVAKWLSFGRVLFSPAHDEIHTIPERRIIVIDGLGNEDWAIYCAVNYEAQKAFVYDLKEKASKRASNGSRTSPNVAGNHRRTEIASFHERFPFPSAYFCAVVVRFPPAMAEAKMKNIMSECRRILLPGGYLELMLLDLDIVNMGVQTRRAVRELKFRMTTADRQISLRPIIDNVQSMLGARGFSNISRCVVGVPVAGRPSRSTDSSSSSRSSGGSDGFTQPGLGDARQATASPRMAFGQGRKETNLSLNDLIADHSDNADAKISKIVSRTARTWWQHCFEASVISDGNLAKSIFADKNVLGECKSRGSSFKMLIAYAQRPVFEGRRRTMSESAVATLATAGAHRQAQASSSASHTA